MESKSVIYVWDDQYFGVFPEGEYITGSRVGVSFCMSLDGSNIDITHNKKTVTSRSFVFSRSISVVIKSRSPVIFINYFPLSFEYFSLLEFCCGELLPVTWREGISPESLDLIMNKHIKEQDLQILISNLISSINGYSPARKALDIRILHVAKLIRKSLPETYTMERYSRDVGLSESRLSHAFKEQVGYSIRSYTLFEKARKALFLMVSGLSYSSASSEAGFTDVAHFSNTVKKFYGLKISDINTKMEIKVFEHLS